MRSFRTSLLATLVATLLSTPAWAGNAEPPARAPAKQTTQSAEIAHWLWGLATGDIASGIEGFAQRAAFLERDLRSPDGYAIPVAEEARRGGLFVAGLLTDHPGLRKAVFSWTSERNKAGWRVTVFAKDVSAEQCVSVADFKTVSGTRVAPWTGALFRERPNAHIGYAIHPAKRAQKSTHWPELVVYTPTGEQCVSHFEIARFERSEQQ